MIAKSFLKIVNYLHWLEMVTVMMKTTKYSVTLMVVTVATHVLAKHFVSIVNVWLEILGKKSIIH